MIKKYHFIIFVALILNTCKKDTSPISINFSGIAETDDYNLILNDDSDDWQPRCRSGISGIYCMLPAFPNPTDSVITFVFYLNHPAEVSVNIYDKPNNQIAEIESANYPTGFNKIEWFIKDEYGNYLDNGLYRAYFIFKINRNDYKSYGDFLINRAN
jgi:hypothetical protein